MDSNRFSYYTNDVPENGTNRFPCGEPQRDNVVRRH